MQQTREKTRGSFLRDAAAGFFFFCTILLLAVVAGLIAFILRSNLVAGSGLPANALAAPAVAKPARPGVHVSRVTKPADMPLRPRPARNAVGEAARTVSVAARTVSEGSAVGEAEALEALNLTGAAIALRLSANSRARRIILGGLPRCKLMEDGAVPEKSVNGVTLPGNKYGMHALCNASYTQPCAVVTYGVEQNYKFELAFAKRSGCRVVACDPTVSHPPVLGPNVYFKPWAAPSNTPRLKCTHNCKGLECRTVKPNCSVPALKPESPTPSSWFAVGPARLAHLAVVQGERASMQGVADFPKLLDAAAHQKPKGRVPATPVAVLKMECAASQRSNRTGRGPLGRSALLTRAPRAAAQLRGLRVLALQGHDEDLAPLLRGRRPVCARGAHLAPVGARHGHLSRVRPAPRPAAPRRAAGLRRVDRLVLQRRADGDRAVCGRVGLLPPARRPLREHPLRPQRAPGARGGRALANV